MLPASEVNDCQVNRDPPLWLPMAALFPRLAPAPWRLFLSSSSPRSLILAKMFTPLLGADFFCANGLLVDVGNRQVFNAETFNSLSCKCSDTVTTKLSSNVPPADVFFRQAVKFQTQHLLVRLLQPSMA